MGIMYIGTKFQQFDMICRFRIVHIYIEIYPKYIYLEVLTCSKSLSSDIDLMQSLLYGSKKEW